MQVCLVDKLGENLMKQQTMVLIQINKSTSFATMNT